MSKRVFIIHGWDGSPQEGCFPWLKSELEKAGYAVFVPAMPEPLRPRIETWVDFLRSQIGRPDEDTILFGHSIGAQTILRYLETLGEGEKIGKAVFLAGWVHLSEIANEDEEDILTAKPWLETPIDWEKVKQRAASFVGIFPTVDPLVPLSDAEIFKDKLGARIIIEKDKGHFSGSDGITELPSALGAITI
ncbi:MAG: alpha/beta hydrolase [Patescibacteria group bacterium]